MLEKIKGPEDIKGFSPAERAELACELRSVIIDTVSKNGGHLASNLGAVELTVALHSVFDSPTDKLIFDVGHQSYAHKLLTGRYDRFDTLRKRGGVCGFLRPSESAHDPCVTGHASSGVSIALGLSRARDLAGESHAVVAVLGDGALTGGLSYEALNDAGHSKTPLIVVLNDNEMSIAKNVGALSDYLTRLRRSSFYQTFKNALRSGLEKSPSGLGARLLNTMRRMRDAVRLLLLGGQFFEALGFDYQGPFDGHDTERLIKAFKRAKSAPGPVLMHVTTQKGHGYRYAEQHPDDYHGIAPFYVETGLPAQGGGQTYGQAAAEALTQLAEGDPRVCAVTAAMPLGTGIQAFGEKFPARTFDVGIAEGHAVTMAAGLALGGMRPYVAIYSTFLQRAYDELIEDVALERLPVTLLIDRAGLVGADGATHQGAYDLSYLRSIPGMVIAAPRDVHALRTMLRLSLAHGGPFAIRYPRDAADMGPRMREGEMTIGQWSLMAAGADAVILAVGRMVETALAVAIELNGRGLSIGVVDARFVKPMDEDMLKKQAAAAPLLVTLEDNAVAGGFGEGVLEFLAASRISTDTLVLGIPDRFIEQGTIGQQMDDCGLSARQVAAAIQARLEARHGR